MCRFCTPMLIRPSFPSFKCNPKAKAKGVAVAKPQKWSFSFSFSLLGHQNPRLYINFVFKKCPNLLSYLYTFSTSCQRQYWVGLDCFHVHTYDTDRFSFRPTTTGCNFLQFVSLWHHHYKRWCCLSTLGFWSTI